MLDQEKISKFIAERRKLQNMTQKQLAEKLNISDKAVSKWETGRSLPDNAILLELCEILGVNVNELLSGETLSDDSYHGKAEENMVNLIQESENEKKLRKRTWTGMMIGAVALAVLLWSIIRISQSAVIWFVDTVSLLAIVVTVFVVLLSAGQLMDFFRAFAICMGRGQEIGTDKIRHSLAACRLVMSTAVIVGVIVTLIGVISIFVQDIQPELIVLNLAVALLSTLYGLIIALFIIPVAGRLRKMV